MGFSFNFDGTALVLNNAEPITFKGAWNAIKGRLLEAGEITEQGGVIQKVMSVTKGATAGETAGETVSALCAMDVSESVVAGEVVTTLTPSAAIAFTPKVVALCAIAGTLGLDFGFRLGQNLVNLYFGDGWDWQAPGIYDAVKDAIRTYIDKDGNTFYDSETITAIGNRLNTIGAFDDGEVVPTLPDYNKPASDYKLLSLGELVSISPDFWKSDITSICEHFNLDLSDNTHMWNIQCGYYGITQGIRECFITPVDGTAITAYLSTYGYYNSSDRVQLPSYVTENSGFISIHSNRTRGGYGLIRGSFSSNLPSDTVIYNSPWSSFSFDLDSHPFFIGNNLTTVGSGGIEGVTKQDGATVPTTFPLDIPNTYPNWLPHPLTVPDSQTLTFPVEMPNVSDDAEPATKPQDTAQTGVNENPAENPAIEQAIERVVELNPELEPEKPPTKDIGKTPIPILPQVQGIGTGFTSIYNPSMSVLSELSQFLWSNDFLDNVKKLFANPMDAIIGLHMLYVTPTRGTPNEIVCGYIKCTETKSDTVASQYVEKSFGSIKINRYYNNILDYAPYTKIQIYLPYIGIVDLDINELMGGTLTVKYRIDVLTGTCLARLIVKRGDYEAELYNFAGNCAIQLPISGGSYSNIIANSIGIAGSIGATVATGGALAPVLVGSAVSAITNSHVNVSHSGTIGSNAGAMGGNIAYLIITRPKPHEAKKYNEFYGKPSNKTVTLSSCSGYTRVKDVHIDNIVATDNELAMIDEILKSGVII